MNERDLEDLDAPRGCAFPRAKTATQVVREYLDVERRTARSSAEVVAEADLIMRRAVIDLFNVVEDFVNASSADDADMLLTDAKVRLARWSPLVRMLIEKRKLWGLT